MAWSYMVIGGLCEIAGAIGLKYREGFTRLWPSAGTVAAMIASFLFLAESLKSIPVGTGYVVWTGIGAAGTAVMGMILFDESRELFRILCILAIVAAIAGLKLSSPT